MLSFYMLGNEPEILDFTFEDDTTLSFWTNQKVRKTESVFRSLRGTRCQILRCYDLKPRILEWTDRQTNKQVLGFTPQNVHVVSAAVIKWYTFLYQHSGSMGNGNSPTQLFRTSHDYLSLLWSNILKKKILMMCIGSKSGALEFLIESRLFRSFDCANC